MVLAGLLVVCLTPGQSAALQKVPPHETFGDAYMRPALTPRMPARAFRAGGFLNVQVNVDAFGNNIVGDAANEPSMAVSSADPNVIVIGWRQFDNIASNFRQAGYGYSHNGGSSWTFPGVIDPGVFRSDPVLGSDSAGNIYYNSLTVNGSDYNTDTYVSNNGGVNWSAPLFSLGGDKQWFTIDTTGGMGNGHVYQAWSTAGNSYFPNQFSRSTNGGANWMNPIEILPQRQVWGTLAVDINGHLFISGQRSNLIYVSKSTNARQSSTTPSFDFTVNVPLGGSFLSNTGPNPGGLLGQVWVATDHSGGPLRGNVYVLSSMNPAGTDPLDVYFSRSQDGGVTWSAPVRVNDDSANANAWQWFGTMSVAPNGRIDVVWNDTRNSLTTNLCQTYTSYSLDGGKTWSKNIPITPQWNSLVGWPNQNKIGDYYHMVSDNLGAGLAHSATLNGEQDVFFTRIEPEPVVAPSSFTLFRGVLSSGGLASLLSSDNDKLVARAGLVLSPAESPVQLIVEGTAPVTLPLELGFLVEAGVSTPNLSQTIELYNFNNDTWEVLSTGPATTADSITHVHVSTNPGRFIRSSDRLVRTRIRYRATGLVLSYPWTVSVDRAHWTVVL